MAPQSSNLDTNDNLGTETLPVEEESSAKPYWRISAFVGLISFDLLVSLLLLTPLVPSLSKGDVTDHYAAYSSVVDLGFLAVVRSLTSLIGLLVSYVTAHERPEHPFDTHHPNGDKKTREEIDEEALEESFSPWLIRFVSRPAFGTELVAVLTQALCVIKSLWRMNVEIGLFHDSQPMHPVFWISVLLTALLSLAEACVLDHVSQLAASYGKENAAPDMLRTLSSLSVPLLSNSSADEVDEEQGEDTPDTEVRGVSDITADSKYKASWKDLLEMCLPDIHLLCMAFCFLILAAISQTLIPRLLGHILDALSKAFQGHDNEDKSVLEVPGFIKNIVWLVIVSICAGVFSGLRGSIFTVVGARVNCRLRIKLMDSLLAQDIGFYDVTKTGDITSRLSSDTTLVGDQVTLNVNVFLRSMVQALGVLGFMFAVSWQLTILAFISVPLITLLSRWYGSYLRSLTKLMQKKLADGNVVSETVLSSMPTVRSFDAAAAEMKEFETCMVKYLSLNYRNAVAYCGYACVTTSLPELVFAVVVFYGGLLVRNEDISSGQLVSFLLYLQSLSDAIASVGWVFGSLTQAVGAADKVFELLNREPKITPPSDTQPVRENNEQSPSQRLQLGFSRSTQQRLQGTVPEMTQGKIEFRDVDLYYPSRPERKVLDGLSLKIEPGSVVALVGESGGGKSSVVSLIQHHYEANSGQVLLDGVEIHELQPAWLSRNISIVSQEPTLFARSIKRNIIYGLEGTPHEPSQEEIEHAARLANAHTFIEGMPQQYETEVGERGVQLSGGQKQRIAIARALVRKPRVLLLDEATSALDAESEHLVQQAIDGMIQRGKEASGSKMTVVIVAHRLSTVRNANSIFVLKKGVVVEQGDHESLLQDEDGTYSALIRRQMEAQQKLDSL